MNISKEIENLINNKKINFVIKDIENILKELDNNCLHIIFKVDSLDEYSKIGRLVFYTRENRRIIATKNYNYISLLPLKIEFLFENGNLILK